MSIYILIVKLIGFPFFLYGSYQWYLSMKRADEQGRFITALSHLMASVISSAVAVHLGHELLQHFSK